MNDLVCNKEGMLTTTSKVVADVFGKAHRNVLIDIERLECSEGFREQNFLLSYYVTSQNKKLKCYNITRDGFAFLCMGFTGKKAAKWKEAYINAFNEMEKGLLNIDKRMEKLHFEGVKINQAGKEWSRLGHDIRKQKSRHEEAVLELMNEVQLRLEV
jgi:Rha family phage regulatory protein